MKLTITILFLLIGFVAASQQNVDTYKVRGRYLLQADKDFVIGANGDTIRNTTQVNVTDTTIVTLGYSILGKDSLRSELSDSIDLVQAENVLTKDSLRQELNDSIDLVQNEIVLAKDSLRSEVADTSLILKQYTNTSVDSVRGELADTSAFIQTLLNNKIDSFYFTNAHEADPLFSNWNKRDGINIYLKQIIDGESILFAIDANTGKDTIGIYHVNRDDLNLVSGENTGDQDLSNYAELDGNQSFTGINEFPSTIKIGPGINEIGYFLSKTNDDGSVVWTSITASQVYKGTWNANTNTPTLANETGTAGWYYRCTVAGTTDFGAGGIAFVIGDDVTYNGSLWERIPASTGYVHPSYQARALKLTGANVIDSIIVDNIGSVSQITTRALSTTDVPEGINKYYTEARVEANSAVALNTDKETNVPTQLSAGTVTGTTYGITSDGSANDIILQEANTTQAGLLGAGKWNEIVANTGKDTTGIYHSNRGVLDGITATDTTWWGSHFVNTDETDQVWIADKPSYFDSTQVKALPVSTFTNDVGYITNASEADPLFSNWNRKDGINIYSKQIIDGDIVFEKELADSENNINVGFTLSSSCLVVFNGQGIPSTVWSGIGTNTLNLSLPTKLYDKIIVKK